MAFNRVFLRVLLFLVTATAALGGSAWGATPVLSLGSASGQVGTTVTIPVTLTTNGAVMSSISTDIGYNTSQLSAPAAVISSTVPSGFTLSSSTPSTGTFRIALLNLSNANTLTDGVVANVTFTVAGAGAATLINAPSATDVDGNDLLINGTNGTITGNGLSQSITFGAAPTLNSGGTGTVSATATSGLGVTFSSTTPSVCSVSGTTVTATAAGTCTIAANQGGNLTFSPAPQVTQDITVGKATQTITFGAAPALTLNGSAGTVSATASSGLGVTFSSLTSTVCTIINGNQVRPWAAGTCTIAADQAGNANFQAAPQATQNITVAKGNQTITFGAAPTLVIGGAAANVSATASSTLPVTFSSTTPSVCTVSGASVTPVAGGTCTIAADQAGNANFNAATQVTQSITIGKGNQTITFGAAPALTVGGAGTVSATATSALPVTFTSTTPTVCTVSNNTVTGVSAGTCTIAANQAGNASFNPAPQVTQNITVNKGSQTISFGAAPALTFNGTAGTLSATATSGLPVTFSSTTPAVCTVSGSTVTPVAGGSCIVAADQAGDASFGAAPQATQTITVAKAAQTVSFGGAPSLTFGSTGTVSATATSGLAVTFTSTTPSVCTVSGSTVTPVAAGTCTVAANQAGNANFAAAQQVTQNITVAKAAQSITFSAPSTFKFSDPIALTASATSGLAVSFSPTTPGVCTVAANGTVTPVTAGTCTIAADQAGNGNFNAAQQVTQTFTITAVAAGAPTGVSAIPGDSKATVSFTAPASNGGSAITGYTVTSIPAGGVDSDAGTLKTVHTVTGLSNGTSYTFTVTATNGVGQSAASAASAAVVPNILTATIGAPSATLVTSASTVSFTVTYTGASTITLAPADVTLNTTGNATGVVAVSGTGSTTRTVTINNISGDGTIGISIAAGTATNGPITALPSTPSATFTVDNTKPVLTVNTLANNSITSNNTLTVVGTVSDALSGVATLTVNGTAVTPDTAGAYSHAVTLENGANTITVVATDAAGNQSTDTRTVTLDHTAPLISNLTPADASFTPNQTVSVAGTLDKRGTVTVVVNGGNPVAATMDSAGTGFTLPVVLTLGANTIDVTATNVTTDGSQTISSTSQRHLTFDNAKPALAITTPVQDITTLLTSATVEGTVTDDTGITLSFKVDGTPVDPQPVVTNGTFSQTIPLSAEKTYAVTVMAIDQAGNSSLVQRNIVYHKVSVSDALRALRITVGLDPKTEADAMLDIAPLQSGKPSSDGVIDISDVVLLLNYAVGNLK